MADFFEDVPFSTQGSYIPFHILRPHPGMGFDGGRPVGVDMQSYPAVFGYGGWFFHFLLLGYSFGIFEIPLTALILSKIPIKPTFARCVFYIALSYQASGSLTDIIPAGEMMSEAVDGEDGFGG